MPDVIKLGPPPSPADCLPSFRKAFPCGAALDDRGVDNLRAAIILRAIQDYYDVCDLPDVDRTDKEMSEFAKHGTCCKEELDRFIDSWWYEALTAIDRKTFRNVIRRHHANGQLPTAYRPRGTDILMDEGGEDSTFCKRNGGKCRSRAGYILEE